MATAKKTKKIEKANEVTDVEPKAPTVKKLERHPLSEKFGPQMTDEELVGLGQDIAAHGQHDDIILFEGKVLAGWNRYMGCLQQGKKPRFKDKDPNSDALAVAFGTNFVRRRLSSVQKAFYGAQFALDSSSKQADVAKLVGCNLNRLNQCCQLLQRTDEEAKKVVETLRTNPEITSGAFDEMLLELGITRTPTPKPAAPPAPGGRTNTFADTEDDDLLGLGGDDDLTGGAIDNLLDDPEEPDTTKNPKVRREVGSDGHTPLPTVGSKGPNLKNPHETPVSRVAKAFRGLEANDQRAFVKFAWGKLQPALNAAIVAGDVAYKLPDPHTPTPAPDKGKKKSGSTVVVLDPSRIARNKKADDEVLEKKKPAAKKTTPAKKSTKKAKK